MAAPIQSLVLDMHYSIVRDVIAPTSRARIGGGAVQVRRLYERPLYRFRVHATHEKRADAEPFAAFAVYHQGDIPFLWSGREYGTVTNAVLVGFGNGTQTNFFLPNRRILTGPTVKVDGTPTGVTLTASSGLIVFAAAPADQTKITAEVYTSEYKCLFWNDSEVLSSEEMFYNQLSKFEGIILQEIFP